MAASLAFTSLLSLVPLVTLALIIAVGVSGVFDRLQRAHQTVFAEQSGAGWLLARLFCVCASLPTTPAG